MTTARKQKAVPAPAPAPSAPVKWEYTTAYLPVNIPDVAAVLNGKGAEGWEVVHVEAGVAYLKRIVPDGGAV